MSFVPGEISIWIPVSVQDHRGIRGCVTPGAVIRCFRSVIAEIIPNACQCFTGSEFPVGIANGGCTGVGTIETSQECSATLSAEQ